MELKGSKTEKNLYTAFTGEVQAYAKYHYYYEKAKEEGYEQLAEFFKYTADNELTHARLIFEKLGFLKDTSKNLEDAISAEAFEYNELYKEFSEVAKEEGFTQIAKLFQGLRAIEHQHEIRFKALLDNLENNKVISNKGNDVTKEYNLGAKIALELAKKYNCKKALLMEKSPSCGVKKIYDGTFSKNLIDGMGITTKLLYENKIEVYSKDEIDLLLR